MVTWAVEPIQNYGPGDGRGRGTYVLEGDRVVAIACGGSWEAARTNARLIAAAPNMLEALKYAIEHAVADQSDDWYARALTAIRKAEAA